MTSLLAVVAVCASAGPASTASAASRTWESCSRTAGDAAARRAGLNGALNRDRVLKRVFSGTSPSSVYRKPTTSLCADYDGDGRLDRALHYQCCTVSSPAPWVVLHGGRRGSTIAYRRLSDTTFKIEGDGEALVTTEPKYDLPRDSFCCPSQLRIGTLRWTGTSFRRSFVIEDT